MHVSGDTTVTVPITMDAVKQLQAAVATLLQTFAAKQKAERPQRWPMMEWRFKVRVCCWPELLPRKDKYDVRGSGWHA